MKGLNSKAQVQQALEFLRQDNTWYYKDLEAVRECDGEPSSGIIWAHITRIHTLAHHGRFVLMDATHKTNQLGWLLYTLMVRNDYGSWLPTCHLLTEKPDGDILPLSFKPSSSGVVASGSFVIF